VVVSDLGDENIAAAVHNNASQVFKPCLCALIILVTHDAVTHEGGDGALVVGQCDVAYAVVSIFST
jgi:hypothetical protein